MHYLEIGPDSPIKPFNEGGDPTLRSTQRYDVIVRVLTKSFTSETADFPALLVAVMNPTESSVDFSAANIAAHSGTRFVRVYSAESYRRKVRIESVFNAIDAITDLAKGGTESTLRANQASGEVADLLSALRSNDEMLTAHTIAPGKFAGGVVRLHAPSMRNGQPLVMQVSLDGDVHEFQFSVHR
jgi:hypothetical protein